MLVMRLRLFRRIPTTSAVGSVPGAVVYCVLDIRNRILQVSVRDLSQYSRRSLAKRDDDLFMVLNRTGPDRGIAAGSLHGFSHQG